MVTQEERARILDALRQTGCKYSEEEENRMVNEVIAIGSAIYQMWLVKRAAKNYGNG